MRPWHMRLPFKRRQCPKREQNRILKMQRDLPHKRQRVHARSTRRLSIQAIPRRFRVFDFISMHTITQIQLKQGDRITKLKLKYAYYT